MRAIALLALTACAAADAPSPPPGRHDAVPTASAVLDDAPASPAPCERRQAVRLVLDGSAVTIDLPLPCVPYDRLTDTPDPQP